jgi:hypothetical protein
MTYLPIPASPLYIEGTHSTTSTTPADTTFTSTHAETTLAATPATCNWTILKTGEYVISAWLRDVTIDNTDVSLAIIVNGVSVDSRTSSVNAAAATLGAGVKWRGTITSGQVVQIQGEQGVGGSATTGGVLIEFVPTEAYPG